MTSIVLHFAHQLGAKPLFSLVKTAQIFEKIMLQDTRDTHQRVAVLAENDSVSISDHFADMWILFLHGHKKIVSLFCAARRSGHLYHKQLSPRFSSQANRSFLVVLLKIVQIFAQLKKAKSPYNKFTMSNSIV